MSRRRRRSRSSGASRDEDVVSRVFSAGIERLCDPTDKDPSHAVKYAFARPQWQDDDAARVCCQCRRDFSAVRRKHHCRNCGLLVCGEDSQKRAVLPHLGYGKQLMRVCDACFILITRTGDSDGTLARPWLAASEAPAPVDTASEGSGDGERDVQPSKPVPRLRFVRKLPLDVASVKVVDARRLVLSMHRSTQPVDPSTAGGRASMDGDDGDDDDDELLSPRGPPNEPGVALWDWTSDPATGVSRMQVSPGDFSLAPTVYAASASVVAAASGPEIYHWDPATCERVHHAHAVTWPAVSHLIQLNDTTISGHVDGQVRCDFDLVIPPSGSNVKSRSLAPRIISLAADHRFIAVLQEETRSCVQTLAYTQAHSKLTSITLPKPGQDVVLVAAQLRSEHRAVVLLDGGSILVASPAKAEVVAVYKAGAEFTPSLSSLMTIRGLRMPYASAFVREHVQEKDEDPAFGVVTIAPGDASLRQAWLQPLFSQRVALTQFRVADAAQVFDDDRNLVTFLLLDDQEHMLVLV